MVVDSLGVVVEAVEELSGLMGGVLGDLGFRADVGRADVRGVLRSGDHNWLDLVGGFFKSG